MPAKRKTADRPSPTNTPVESKEEEDTSTHPRNLIPELCRQMYTLGWVTGTGGSISIRRGDDIYITPSGVHKERIKGDDMYIIHPDQTIKQRPSNPTLSMSQCTPLFFTAYNMRHAGACIHTHSQHAVMVTLNQEDTEFRITHQEMIKGIKVGSSKVSLRYFDDLVVPIIENTAEEEDLQERMALAIKGYPDTNAILVRRHGVYVWGKTWEMAKSMAECYDYLFQISIKMKKMGLQPHAIPPNSDYRHTDGSYKDGLEGRGTYYIGSKVHFDTQSYITSGMSVPVRVPASQHEFEVVN